MGRGPIACINCYREGISPTEEVCPECGLFFASALRDVLPHGTLLCNGTYRIDYAMRKGGFGIVYRAIVVSQFEAVAIKEFFPQQYVARGITSRLRSISALKGEEKNFEREYQRFIAEGQILSELHHPGIVRVRHVFAEQGTAYLVMDLVEGRTLRQELQTQPDGRLALERVEAIVIRLVSALAEIHDAGIYHLDIKPENVVATATKGVVLVDFGAARQTISSHSMPQFDLSYAAPEVLEGKEVGPESDLFELGMMVHELLTGQRPPLDRPYSWTPTDLPAPWQKLLSQALQLSRDKRPKSVLKWWEARYKSSNSTILSTKPPKKVSLRHQRK